MRLSLIVLILIMTTPAIGFAMNSNNLADLELLAFQKKMPSAALLEQRLRDRGLGRLVENSNVIQKLAGSSKDISALSIEIGFIIVGYNSYLKHQPDPNPEARLKSKILEACLEDDPRALNLLHRMHLYAPAQSQ